MTDNLNVVTRNMISELDDLITEFLFRVADFSKLIIEELFQAAGPTLEMLVTTFKRLSAITGRLRRSTLHFS